MARTLPQSKLNREKIDADKAYNRIQNRKVGQDHLELESQPGPQQADASPDWPANDPAGAKGALDE